MPFNDVRRPPTTASEITNRGQAVLDLIWEVAFAKRLSLAGLKRLRKYAQLVGLNQAEFERVCDLAEYTPAIRENLKAGVVFGRKKA